MSRKVKSAEVIGRLLGAEGFSDYLANQIEHYWKTRSGLTERQQKSIKVLRKEFSGIMANLSKAECLVIGRFIGFKEKMAFDTGLKIGLQAFAQKTNKEIE